MVVENQIKAHRRTVIEKNNILSKKKKIRIFNDIYLEI
jgi:hypothetical protein